MRATITAAALLAGCLLGALSADGADIIDVTWGDGTGTNPTFLEIDNGVGGGASTWTQSTGVLDITTANNAAAGAASDTTLDFTSLGGDSLVLTVSVESTSGTMVANGNFIGFQTRTNDGAGTDLWNNQEGGGPSFGFVMPGSASVGLGLRHVAPGGDAGSGRYQAGASLGQATVESIQDGYDVTVTVNNAGWDLAISGLLDDSDAPISGSSGTWGTDGINEWAAFGSEMRAGFSLQTTGDGGALNFASINLTQVPIPEPASSALLALGGLAFVLCRRTRKCRRTRE